MDQDRKTIIHTFQQVVNMTAGELSEWLEQPESKKVGFKATPDEESVGHKSGTRIVKLLKMKQAEYTDDDLKHMRKVVGYVRRHLAQRPLRDVSETRWRYSLMNWGHDPLKMVRRKK